MLTKAQVLDAMLKGIIHFDGMGRAGFEAVSQSLRVYGDTAVVTGDWQLQATGKAKNVETDEEYSQDHQWKAVHSQMTRVPAGSEWRLALV